MLNKPFATSRLSMMTADIAHLFGAIPLNDPTTPALSANMPLPAMGPLKYAVQGMTLPAKSPNDARALNCHMTVGNCVNLIQKMLNKPLQRWSATNLLQVVPSAGADMNAYYDRKSLKFFYYRHGGSSVYFGDSADIIAHELGHAVLDAMRPDFWSVQSLEIWSYHEAFSDIVAVFNMLNHDSVINAVLEETKGDLRSSNHASRLAEQVGRLIRSVTKDRSYLANALRDPAVERFHYVDPARLPKETSNDRLAAECHSFGRVFSAAWYEAFVRSYELQMAKGLSPYEAIKKSRDMCFSVLLKASATSPRVPNYYEAVSNCLVSISSELGPEYPKLFSDVFIEWGILKSGSVKALSGKSWSEVVVQLSRGDSVVKTATGAMVSMKKPMSFKLSELPLVAGLSMSPDLKVEVPFDSFYEFDSNGQLVKEITPDMDSLLSMTAECVSLAQDEVRPDGMWEIREGRLERRLIR